MNKTLKDINIDYLFLNLTKCKRCLDTNTALENAVSKVFKLLGDNRIKIDVNNIHINTEDKAREFGLEVSPTIRINGRDIQSDWTDNQCSECGDLCNCAQCITCRVWKWNGKEYLAAPENLIVDAILENIYCQKSSTADVKHSLRELNSNMKTFFAETRKGANLNNSSCC